MFPKGDGRIAVRHPREHGLPLSAAAIDDQGNAIPDTEIYDIAIVRQLDCLVSPQVDLSNTHSSDQDDAGFHPPDLDRIRRVTASAALRKISRLPLLGSR